MKPKYNLVYGEKYQSGTEEKTRWTNHGVVLVGVGRDGKPRMTVKINSLPVGFDGYLSVFPLDDKKPNQVSGASEDINLDDIPF